MLGGLLWSLYRTICGGERGTRVEETGQKTETVKNLGALITSWQIDRETVADFILGGSKITVGVDCSHEIKRHLLLGRKAMTNLDSILKSRDITLLTKAYLVKAKVLPSSHIWM